MLKKKNSRALLQCRLATQSAQPMSLKIICDAGEGVIDATPSTKKSFRRNDKKRAAQTAQQRIRGFTSQSLAM
jgi:hypothetical protein